MISPHPKLRNTDLCPQPSSNPPPGRSNTFTFYQLYRGNTGQPDGIGFTCTVHTSHLRPCVVSTHSQISSLPIHWPPFALLHPHPLPSGDRHTVLCVSELLFACFSCLLRCGFLFYVPPVKQGRWTRGTTAEGCRRPSPVERRAGVPISASPALCFKPIVC